MNIIFQSNEALKSPIFMERLLTVKITDKNPKIDIKFVMNIIFYS